MQDEDALSPSKLNESGDAVHICATTAVQDPLKQSCAAAFNHSETARVVERDGRWHHLAVTWTAANDGLTQIFLDGVSSHSAFLLGYSHAKSTLHMQSLHWHMCAQQHDVMMSAEVRQLLRLPEHQRRSKMLPPVRAKRRAGLLVSSAATGKTEPLQPGGALMLGNEQDCYGGCTDIGQAYNGLIDEVCVRAAVLDRSVCIEQLRSTQDVKLPALSGLGLTGAYLACRAAAGGHHHMDAAIDRAGKPQVRTSSPMA